jgi:hypothetical protein
MHRADSPNWNANWDDGASVCATLTRLWGRLASSQTSGVPSGRRLLRAHRTGRLQVEPRRPRTRPKRQHRRPGQSSGLRRSACAHGDRRRIRLECARCRRRTRSRTVATRASTSSRPRSSGRVMRRLPAEQRLRRPGSRRSRFACLASGITAIARGLALGLERDLLVGFPQLASFALRPVRLFAGGKPRCLARLFGLTRLRPLGGAQLACGREGLARDSLLDDGRIVRRGSRTKSLQRGLPGRCRRAEPLAERGAFKGSQSVFPGCVTQICCVTQI